MATFFSDYFGIETSKIDDFGAYNVSLVTDLPLFIDPFLLFNSKNSEYQALHRSIIDYLIFLKGKALAGVVDKHLLKAWYCFPEVKQTWLGFSALGNDGRGLGMDFARALHGSLVDIFKDFGKEKITKGSHLEKVCLIKDGVGRDNISDFTTNLIKDFLYEYTARFAREHLGEEQCQVVAVKNARFNYDTESWETRTYRLPFWDGDHVVLVPKDMLTRDETWINRTDLIRGFVEIPTAIPDPVLRAQISNYFENALRRRTDREPSQRERDEAAIRAVSAFPEVIDYFILLKEKRGAEAEDVSREKVKFSEALFNHQLGTLQRLLAGTEFYRSPVSTFEETLERARYLKHVIEDQDGYRLFYRDGKPVRFEKDLQIMFRLVWFGTPSDVSSEVNDGRGPADFKVARGAKDKTIVEMKLASNTALKRNLEKQAPSYQRASNAKSAVKIIIFFNDGERGRVLTILKELKMQEDQSIILIDARRDNKPSGSKA